MQIRKKVKYINTAIIENTHLNIYRESDDQLLKTENITNEKGKIAFMSPGAGQYKICVTYYGPPQKELVCGIKINSDNMDEPKLTNALKFEDVDPLNEKVEEILKQGRNIISYQELDLEDEDEIAQYQMNSSKNYYVLTIIQIVVIVSLGIYQIFNFRKFLSLNQVI